MSRSSQERPRTAAAARFVLALLCSCALPGEMKAFAEPAQKPVEPQVLHQQGATTEVGLLGGAAYRIDIPAEWNHSLIVYYHGYAQTPVSFHIAEKLRDHVAPLLERRYAIAQSAYSETGWALQQAYPETEELRKYFVKKYGQPKETFVAGTSMGGVLVAVTLELNPKPYVAGFDLCGSVGPTYEALDRRFALRAAFDHFFPGVLPVLVPTPADYEASPAMRERVFAALRANPVAAAQMRSLADLHNDADLAYDMVYFTFVIGDMQRRAHGNPFDNRNLLYTGTSSTGSASDFDLNDKVRRYAALPAARDYLVRHYTPNGHLGRPMLAVHTIYDPVVPAGSLATYAGIVEAAGAGQNLVQQYVRREGHCNIADEDVGRAFDELVGWAHGGARPVPGLLR